MKPVRPRAAAILAALASALLLTSCVFEKPVFGGGSAPWDPAWTGLWTVKESGGKPEQAAVIPLGGHHALVQYPVGADGYYFDAQHFRSRGRDLLQLKILAGPGAKAPAPHAANYTLVWLEPRPGGALAVRSLDESGVKKAGLDPRALRKFLAAPDSDWNEVFGRSVVFTNP